MFRHSAQKSVKRNKIMILCLWKLFFFFVVSAKKKNATKVHWNQCNQSWNPGLTETTLQKNVLLGGTTQNNTGNVWLLLFYFYLSINNNENFSVCVEFLFSEISFSSRESIEINGSCCTMCVFWKHKKRRCPAVSQRGNRKISELGRVCWDWWWTEPHAIRALVKRWGIIGKWGPGLFLSPIATFALWWRSFFFFF